MPGIYASNIRFYRCLNWEEGDSHGGDIDLNNEILSNVDEAVFDDVSNEERSAGSTEYRKIFVRNLNTGAGSDWEYVKAWISQETPATNSEIFIASGTNDDTLATASGYDFQHPLVKASGIDLGTISSSGYAPLWIRRVISQGGPGYTQDSFEISFESS